MSYQFIFLSICFIIYTTLIVDLNWLFAPKNWNTLYWDSWIKFTSEIWYLEDIDSCIPMRNLFIMM